MPTIPTQVELEAEYQLFAQSIENYFSSASAKKASALDGSGALLAEDPVTFSGDAWESAARHVLSIPEKCQSNGETWHQIGQFLDSMPRAES